MKITRPTHLHLTHQIIKFNKLALFGDKTGKMDKNLIN